MLSALLCKECGNFFISFSTIFRVVLVDSIFY